MDFEEAIAIAFGSQYDAQKQRQAEVRLEVLLQQPELFGTLITVVQTGLHTLRPEVAFWSCRALCQLIARQVPADPQKLGLLAHACVTWMSVIPTQEQGAVVAPHVLNGFAQLLAVLYQHLEPSGWPAFWAEIARCCIAPNTPAGYDLFLRIIEAIDDYAASSNAIVAGDLQHNLSIRRQMLANNCVTQVLSGAAIILHRTGTKDVPHCAKALRILQKYACWVDTAMLLSIEGMIDNIWRCTAALATALEACDCLTEIVSHITTPTVELLASLHVFSNLPALVGVALKWVTQTGIEDGNDAWELEEYGVKVAYLTAVTGKQILRCATADGAMHPIVQSSIPWLIAIAFFDLQEHKSERDAVRVLHGALLQQFPQVVGPLLQLQLTDALKEANEMRLAGILGVIHGLGKGVKREVLKDVNSVHGQLMLQVLGAQVWQHPETNVAALVFRILQRFAPFFTGEGQVHLLTAVGALLGTSGVLHSTSTERRVRAAKSFRKFSLQVRSGLLIALKDIARTSLDAIPLGIDVAGPLLVTLGTLFISPDMDPAIASQYVLAIMVQCMNNMRTALLSADIPQLSCHINALTALAQGLLGPEEMPSAAIAPFFAAAEMVLQGCKQHGHSAAIRTAAVQFLLSLLPLLPMEPMVPVIQQMSIAILPLTNITETGGILRLVEQLVTSASELDLTNMIGELFPQLLGRVLQLSHWDLLRLDVVPEGFHPVLSEEGRLQGEFQVAFLTLLLSLQWKGYGSLMLAHDPLQLTHHVVTGTLAMLHLDVPRRSFDVLTGLLEELSPVDGFQDFVLCTLLPYSLQGIFHPHFVFQECTSRPLLSALSKLHRQAFHLFGTPVTDALRAALSCKLVPTARIQECLESLTTKETSDEYRVTLGHAIEDAVLTRQTSH